MVILTIIGIIFKSFYAGKYKKSSTLVYVFMGWGSLYLMPQIWEVIPRAGAVCMVASGITYTLGALLYAFGKFKYVHMVWHVFVILAGVFMFISINFFILQFRT
jgi:hemolysin III